MVIACMVSMENGLNSLRARSIGELLALTRTPYTVHNMLVDDKIFCITFTFEWTF